MKKGYTIENSSFYGYDFYIVDNYKFLNNITTYGTNKKFGIFKSESSIGVWKIKYKN